RVMPVSRSRTSRSASFRALWRPMKRVLTSASAVSDLASAAAASASFSRSSGSTVATLSNAFSSFRGHGNEAAHAPARAAEETTLSAAPPPGRRAGAAKRRRRGEQTSAPILPPMSEYDTWAPVYDAWASDMTEDVAHYVSLAREADGPIVELMVGSG